MYFNIYFLHTITESVADHYSIYCYSEDALKITCTWLVYWNLNMYCNCIYVRGREMGDRFLKLDHLTWNGTSMHCVVYTQVINDKIFWGERYINLLLYNFNQQVFDIYHTFLNRNLTLKSEINHLRTHSASVMW